MKKKRSKAKGWVLDTPKATPTVPETTTALLNRRMEQFINDALKPMHIKPPPHKLDMSYIADIYSKWYRHYVYLCSKYNDNSPDAISPSFEMKFARLEYVADDRYNLSYMRHTGQWFELHKGITLDDCMNVIKGDGNFYP
ncbi:hypothetical protein MBAV_003109 [Candidatus Magnetobacterium bavaricum]|uniref:Uncharacterized protein n=1 Tax=Candidatus Magnetobacterium bavaricum TaxID=29290 RepID=A0A0F3GS17_9BACT|nr:hypothetical protein MBAV_003109 [Candidatus Magnetobacterium bavaricum]